VAYKTFSQLYNDGLQQADEVTGSGTATAKTIIKAGINESYSEVAGIRDWKTLENSTAVNTVASTEEYTPITASETVPRIRRISSIVDQTSNRFLDEITREKFEKYYPDPSSTGASKLWYQSGYTSDRDIKFKLYQIPDSVYALNVIYYEEPLELVADGDIPRIPDQFHYGLVYLGLAKYFEYQKDAMANYYRTMHEEFKRKILVIEYGDTDDMPQIEPQGQNKSFVTGKIGRIWN